MKYKRLLADWKSISTLAVGGLLISAFIIAGAMYYIFPMIGFPIPFLVALLF